MPTDTMIREAMKEVDTIISDTATILSKPSKPAKLTYRIKNGRKVWSNPRARVDIQTTQSTNKDRPEGV